MPAYNKLTYFEREKGRPQRATEQLRVPMVWKNGADARKSRKLSVVVTENNIYHPQERATNLETTQPTTKRPHTAT